jgi:hypothetical protein
MDSGAILTAVVAASAASLAAVVTKDAKISEFRQQWIDAVREDVSKYCSVCQAFYWCVRGYDGRPPFNQKQSQPVTLDDLLTLDREITHLEFRIKLRLDPQKPDSIDLISSMDKLTTLAAGGGNQYSELETGTEKVLLFSQIVLDKAWVRVRRGEHRFQAAIWIAFTALFMSVVAAVLHWIAQHSDSLHQKFPWI